MASCVELSLSWTIGGVEVRGWPIVQVQNFLDDLISENSSEEQLCEVKVVHNAIVLLRLLHHKLRKLARDEAGVVVFGFVGG